jgi:GntR family transcriptional regulator/MocR family aminotransferase
MTVSWATSGVDLHLDVAGGRRRAALEDALRDAVRSGRLVGGTRLPSSRALAADVGLARNTVAEAYGQLVAEGWLTAQQGSGTRVAERTSTMTAPSTSAPPAAPRPAGFDLSAGAPDVSLFPRTVWAAAIRRALVAASAVDLGFADPRGLPALRHALAAYLARTRGVRADAEQIVVCSGFTDGLDLIAEVLAGLGRSRVGVEAYGHRLHREIVERRGLRVHHLAVDGQGAVPEPTIDLQAIVLTPAHQFPLGAVLAPSRRAEIVEWAGRRDGLVLEDDYDGEFRFDRHPVGALQALAPDRVIFAGTASKTLMPGLRLGWLVVPRPLVDAVVEVRRRSGRLTSVTDQLALAEMITHGDYDRQVRRARLAYRRRREQVVTVVRHAAPAAEIVGAAAGLHLVLRLPPGIAENGVITEAAGRGLVVQGLGEFAQGVHDQPPALVIGYARPPEHAFSGALARLVATLQAVR